MFLAFLVQRLSSKDAQKLAGFLIEQEGISLWSTKSLREELLSDRIKGYLIREGEASQEQSSIIGCLYWRVLVDELEILNLGVDKRFR